MRFPVVSTLLLGISATMLYAVEPVLSFDFNDPTRVFSKGSDSIELVLRNIRVIPGGVPEGKGGYFLDNSRTPIAGDPGGYAVTEGPWSMGDLTSFTICGWIRKSRSDKQVDAARLLLWKSTQGGIDLRLDTNRFVLVAGGYESESQAIAFKDFKLEEDSPEWTFFALTWSVESGGEVALWIGQNSTKTLEKVGADILSSTPLVSANSSLIIAAGTGGSRALAAQLDDLQIYASGENASAALSESELKRIFEKGVQ